MELAGVPGITDIDVSPIGKWADPLRSKLSMDYCVKYCTTVKKELVCEAKEVEKFVSIIIEKMVAESQGEVVIQIFFQL